MKKITDKIKNEFYGCYIGKVKDREDPLKLGRLRVQVFNLHSEDISTSKLPWFLPAYPITAAQLQGIGDSGLPEIDSIVIVQFIEGNINQGIYTHSIPGSNDLPNPDNYLEGTGWRQIKTPSGHIIDIKDKIVKITQDDSSSFIEINDGTITINGAAKINIVAADEVNVEGSTITLKNNGPGKNELLCDPAKFKQYFDSHIHPSGTGPTGPPMSSHLFNSKQDWHTKTIKVD